MVSSISQYRWGKDSTFVNNVDNIERYLLEDGHLIWGFVIYRCTYESDDDWNKLMKQLRQDVKECLETYNGLDMEKRVRITAIEDKSILNDASTSFVREHFKQWTATAPQREQAEGVGPGLSQRYQFCLQVDDAALDAIVHDTSEIGQSDAGFVNLIWKDWEPNAPGQMDEGEEDIEGCTQHDVGWIMVAFHGVMIDMYNLLRDSNDWLREYRRPLEVVRP
ncbi:hypothetical protein DL95DRAFT_484953 [Leptodontidium sp. 2 PMI_412]|nr:hypothetical protein DL95DRAFT_484953 [Leptodontidium sp. 2 PMI_412]